MVNFDRAGEKCEPASWQGAHVSSSSSSSDTTIMFLPALKCEKIIVSFFLLLSSFFSNSQSNVCARLCRFVHVFEGS